MGFFGFVVICCLVAAAGYFGKPWVDHRLLLHRENHPKKREEETASTSSSVDDEVEIVVPSSSVKRESDRCDDGIKPQAPVASSLPSRLARQQLGSPLNVEASIRTALRELRSRQVVKTICSKFESRLSKTGSGSQEAEEEKEENGGYQVHRIQYQPLLTRQEEMKPAEPVNPVPAPRHSTDGTALSAARSNNLNAFLRRYSSNLEKAVKATEAALSSTLTTEPAVKDCEQNATSNSVPTLDGSSPMVTIPIHVHDTHVSEDDAVDLEIENEIPEAIAPPLRRMSAPLLNLTLDIDPIATITVDNSSNQCDDDVITDSNEYVEDEEEGNFLIPSKSTSSAGSDNNSNGQVSPISIKAKTSASRIPMPNGARSLSRSSFSGELSSMLKLQAPEKTTMSVSRLQQFRQQLPANSSHLD